MNVTTIGFPFGTPSAPTGATEAATGFADALDALVAGGVAAQTPMIPGTAGTAPLLPAVSAQPMLPGTTANAATAMPGATETTVAAPAPDKASLAMAQLLATSAPIVLGAGPQPLGGVTTRGGSLPAGKAPAATPATDDAAAALAPTPPAPTAPEADAAALPVAAPAPALAANTATKVVPTPPAGAETATDPDAQMVALPDVEPSLGGPDLPRTARDSVAPAVKSARPGRSSADVAPADKTADEAAATAAATAAAAVLPVAVPVQAPVADQPMPATGKRSARPDGADQPVAATTSLSSTAPGAKVAGGTVAAPAAAEHQSATNTGTGERGEGAGNPQGAPIPASGAATSHHGAAAPAFTVPGAPQSAAATSPTAPAAPAVAATAEPVVNARPGELGRSIGLEIARKVDAGEDTLRVRLNPAELGKVEVTLAFDDDGGLRATLRAESAHTLHLLRQDAPDLGRALDQAGLRTDAQSFRFEGRDGGTGGNGGQSSFQQQSRGSQQQFRDDPEPDVQAYRTLRGDGQVDMIA
ncbi:flagellar hook-length control protein FliK [Sphingomonas sp. RS6]